MFTLSASFNFFIHTQAPTKAGIGIEQLARLAYRYAFLCNVPSTSRTLLFSDKAWVYKRHFVLDCDDCSMAQWIRAKRTGGSAALVLDSILSTASLVICFEQSGSPR